MFVSTVLTALLFGGFHATTAQQFEDYIFPHESLGLSSKCFAAVNTTVASCPGWVASHAGIEAASFSILPETALEQLCGGTCQDDLVDLKGVVAGACTASEDVMVPPGGIAYPATFFIDRILYAAGMSCLKNSATGEYCDTVVATWMNQTEPYTEEQNCHECQIGIQAKQLASPFGYDEEAATDFDFTTSSCAASTYTYSTPTAYPLNSTTGLPARPTCVTGRTYTILADDTCNTISEAQEVATEALISMNGLDLACQSLPPVGTVICLPQACVIRELAYEDTCESITAAANITLGQLLAWNPVISAGCANLHSWRGRFICVSSPAGTIDVPDGDTVTTEAPIPTNTQGESNTHCAQWYSIKEGDSCAAISLANGITLADFYFLNPGVDSVDCKNLWLGYAYCVKAVGNIQTYPDYPVVVPSTTFTRPPVTSQTPPPVFELPALNPTAPDTVQGCDYYENAWPESVTTQRPDANKCANWASTGDVTVAQLLLWNPSLREEDCELLAEYSYCIHKDDESDTTDPVTTATEPPITTTTEEPPTSTTGGGVAPPAETQPGAIASCVKWHVVVDGDGCWDLSATYAISLDDFYKWNPGVGTGCESLWKDYAVCVGI